MLIVGGGIGGLALAAFLGRSFNTTVLERLGKFRSRAWSLTIWPVGMHALEALGLEGPVRRAGWPLVESLVRTPSGRVLSRTRVARALRGGGGAIAIDRGRLHTLLMDAALDAGARVEMHRPVQAAWNEGGGAAVRLRDGSERRADLVVGADGLRSVTREALVGVSPPTPLGVTLVRGLCPAGDASLRAGRAFETWGTGQRFGAVQIGRSCVCWFAGLNLPPDRAPARPLETVLERFARWHEPIPSLIRATRPLGTIVTPIFDRPTIATQRLGALVLIGDAAHPMAPDLGLGACTALEDALALSRTLHAGPSLAGALERFEAQRVAPAGRAVRQSRRMSALAQAQPPPLCLARDLALWLTPAALLERSLRRLAMPHAGP